MSTLADQALRVIGRGWLIAAAGVWMAAACQSVRAQAAVVTPTFSILETATNNRDLTTADRQFDFVTQLTPGITIASRRGPIQGSIAYSLNGLLYAREGSLNSIFHNLAATGKASAYEGRLGLDATATANRQVVSALGTQSVDPALNSRNQTQVFSYGLTPYITGRLPGNVAVRGQVAYQSTQAEGSTLGDTNALTASVRLGGRTGTLGWSFDGSRQIAESGDRPRSHNGRLNLGLTHQPDFEWQYGLRLGTEVDDLLTGRSQRTDTWGLGLVWTPTPRSTVKAEIDGRFYGRSHLLSVSHRMSRVVLSASDSRSLQTGGVAGRSTVSNYDLLFQQYASTVPDPASRDAFVRAQLTEKSLDPNAMVVAGGFLTGGPTLNRVRNLTSSYQGIRSTVTVSYVLTVTESVGGGLTGDDLTLGRRVRQRAVMLSWSHRMSPVSNLLVVLSGQRTSGEASQAATDLQSITTTWTTRLGQHTSVSLGLRHVTFDSETNPYQESALIGSLRMQF